MAPRSGEDDDVSPIPESRHDRLPWIGVCKLVTEYEKGPKPGELGTGWIASPTAIVTAAHCLHEPKLGRRLRVKVSVGFKLGQAKHVVTLEDPDIRVAPNWPGPNLEWDLAVIRLAEPLPLGFGLRHDRELDLAGAVVMGFPRDSTSIRICEPTSIVSQNGRLIYACSNTIVGMSGGPLVVFAEGQYHVVGVHTHGSASPTQGLHLDPVRANWLHAEL